MNGDTCGKDMVQAPTEGQATVPEWEQPRWERNPSEPAQCPADTRRGQPRLWEPTGAVSPAMRNATDTQRGQARLRRPAGKVREGLKQGGRRRLQSNPEGYHGATGTRKAALKEGATYNGTKPSCAVDTGEGASQRQQTHTPSVVGNTVVEGGASWERTRPGRAVDWVGRVASATLVPIASAVWNVVVEGWHILGSSQAIMWYGHRGGGLI